MPSFTPETISGSSNSTADMFAPVPRFPTSSETSSVQMIESGAHGTRKRSRFNPTNSTPYADPWTDSSLAASRFSNAKSPPPLANDRYQLAGGMERPNIFAKQNGDYDDYYHLEKQRGMWSTPTSPPAGLPTQWPDNNTPTPNATKPWVLNQLLTLVGGVAGTLVQFCSRPFRGFQAGGGQAYSFGGEAPVPTAQDDPFLDHTPGLPVTARPLPGEFPEDNYGVLSIESLEDERPRVSKRLRTGENWVMVGQDGEMQSRPSSPRLSERRVPTAQTRSPSQIPRPVSRTSTNTTPKRPSLIPTSRRSTLDRRAFQGVSRNMPNMEHTTPRSYRQSFGSPAMFKETSNSKKSPLPVESQRLINKMKREELEEDARMRRMSSQMTALLKEAQEALGTKFEVQDDVMGLNDEGYSEGAPWHQR